MKRLIGFLLVLLAGTQAFSQKRYFVYIQAEPEQAFFVKRLDKTFPSNATGYLTLSRLPDSAYSFLVGFPQNKWPDQYFTIDINGRDHGYLLKNFGEKGWGLFDLQSMSVIMATKAPGDELIRTEPRQVSAFTAVLAKAANDPSLTQRTVIIEKPVQKEVVPETAVVKQAAPVETSETVAAPVLPVAEAKKEEVPKQAMPAKETELVRTEEISPKFDTVQIVADTALAKVEKVVAEKKEEPVVAKIEPVAETVVAAEAIKEKEAVVETLTEVAKTEPEYKRSTVTRRAESSTTDGFGITFTDVYPDGKRDTIRIMIPNPKTPYVLVETKKPVEKAATEVKEKEVKEEKKEVVQPVQEKASAAGAKYCASVAKEEDFVKLRRKMVAESDDDDMVEVARKTFKGRCFTSEQVKNLSALFLNDAGKYKFFDAAYPYISDPPGFSALEGELKDEYYKSRFRAMLR